MTTLYKGLRISEDSFDLSKLEPRAAANGCFLYLSTSKEYARNYGELLIEIEVESQLLDDVRVLGCEVLLTQTQWVTIQTYADTIRVAGKEL